MVPKKQSRGKLSRDMSPAHVIIVIRILFTFTKYIKGRSGSDLALSET